MGLARFINKQFIDVIDWTEEGDDVLAWRFPTADLEIQQGAALIVRDTQTAVFVDEGRVADRFTGGNGVAGVAAASTAGNAVAVPAIIASANPAYADAAAQATILVAACVVVTAIVVPLVTAWTARRVAAPRS